MPRITIETFAHVGLEFSGGLTFLSSLQVPRADPQAFGPQRGDIFVAAVI